MEENKLYCSHCGALIDDDDYEEVNGEIVCSDCYEHHTTTCERCGSTIWTDDSYGDDYTTLCRHCYERMMPITLTAMTTALNATTMKLINPVVSMIMATSLNLYFMVILSGISA